MATLGKVLDALSACLRRTSDELRSAAVRCEPFADRLEGRSDG
jgi:hypothetical protein